MTISLRNFGSYSIGGRLHEVTLGERRRLAVTPTVSIDHDPKGHYAVEHAYVQYFVPANRNSAPPIVLVHGGGMSGSVWERTPDARPGWLQLLLLKGFEVHVIDNVERGRAGFAPDIWEGGPVLRSLEEAWRLFRIGHDEGFVSRRAFTGQRFPFGAMEEFARSFVPRWLSTAALQSAAVFDLLNRLGGGIVVCHSQGADATFGAIDRGAKVNGVLAVEPSAIPSRPENLSGVPTVLLCGDFLDIDAFWKKQNCSWREFERKSLSSGVPISRLSSAAGLPKGHSHLPMLDNGNDRCLDLCLEALNAKV